MEFTIVADEFGPAKTLWLLEPKAGLEAFVVVDNVACGPAIGGIRMAPDLTVSEVARLARAMTLKNAAAGLPHGGGKAGIVASPSMPRGQKESLVRAFACAIRGLTDYVPGPDMGVNDECMAWIKDEIGRVVGLPRVLGGIPLDEIGATGFGLAIAAEVAVLQLGFELQGATVTVQGFGAVGMHAARFLSQRGARLVAASDSRGVVFNGDGLSIDDLIAHKRSGQPLHAFRGGRAMSAESLVGVDCNIWIPAARPDVLTDKNVADLKARLVLQGANIPATSGAEEWMHAKGILSVPDFIANAGGVICASVEYHGGTQAQAMTAIEERIRTNTSEMLEKARKENCTPRQAAVSIALERIKQAMGYRRYS